MAQNARPYPYQSIKRKTSYSPGKLALSSSTSEMEILLRSISTESHRRNEEWDVQGPQTSPQSLYLPHFLFRPFSEPTHDASSHNHRVIFNDNRDIRHKTDSAQTKTISSSSAH